MYQILMSLLLITILLSIIKCKFILFRNNWNIILIYEYLIISNYIINSIKVIIILI